MATQTTRPKYDSMTVLHIGFRGNPSLTDSSTDIASTLEIKYFDGEVEYVDEVDMGLDQSMSKEEMCARVEACFVAWVERTKPRPGQRMLRLVGYFGHGNIEDRDDWQHFHLFAGTQDSSFEFDLTRLQQVARDRYESDFLFYFECCESGGRPNVGMDSPAPALLASPKAQIIETLGAGITVHANGSEKDWGKRFEMNLYHDTEPKTVGERHCEIATGESLWTNPPPWAPGTYQLEYPPNGTASIVLQPVAGKLPFKWVP